MGLSNIKDIDHYYLTIFLRSIYGFNQLYRERELTIQFQLTLERVGRILIFEPTKMFQKLIRELLINSLKFHLLYFSSFNISESILLKELKLENWKAKHKLSFIKYYSNTEKYERLDAEYYQPMYEELEVKIKSIDYTDLNNIVRIKKCVEPGSDVYQEKGILFLRVSNLDRFEIIEDNCQFISKSLYNSLNTYQPCKGEILLTKDATPGIAYYLNNKPKDMIPSGGILRLKIKDETKILPEYLTLVLNSLIVQKQMERDSGGSVINHWRLDQIKNTIIPILTIDLQNNISFEIRKSFEYRQKSKDLLNIAKRAVEIAIEESEEKAMKFIKERCG